MGFISDLFNDDNNINEKSVVGFASFAVMVLAITVDLVTGWLGKELLINEYIFNGFLTITLGSFGIASVDKFVNKKAENDKLAHLDSIQPEPIKEEEELG
jgi:ABC-type uncharacterized transport system permease subunit